MGGIGYYARSTPDSAAIVIGNASMTFEDVDRRSRALAGALFDGGLRVGDRIAVFSANRPEAVEVTTAGLRAGIVPVPINVLLTRPEVEYLLEDSGAVWLFTDRALDSQAAARIVTFGDAYERLIHEAEPRAIADTVLGRPMHYTSGTTGAPKGVWVAPQNEDVAAARSEDFRREWGLESDEVHLVCSPLAHSAPLRFAIRTLEAGGTLVLQSRFDAAETLAAVEWFGATSTFMVPTHLERIVALGEPALSHHDLSTMRTLAHAGAPVRSETKQRIIELWPPGSVWEFYGSTEGPATRISADEWLRKPGSVGTPPPGGHIVVTGDDDAVLPAGEAGTVWIHHPAMERFEYWGDPAKTATAWRSFSVTGEPRDVSAFTVGDLGYADDDGYLFLTGRTHDMIITGGVNVYPQEVEAILTSHPAVEDAAVYGAPHDEWGEEVRALVVAAGGEPLDAEELRRWARDRIAGFKCPRRIDVVDELPRTATGKLKRSRPG
jgi:long-chain acyl-CoA synthetase